MSQRRQEQILERVKFMPDDQQRRVLDFVRTLAISRPRGVTGKDLLHFAGAIPPDDADLMARAIDEGSRLYSQPRCRSAWSPSSPSWTT